MTPAEREQQAQEFLAGISGIHHSGSMGSSYDEYLRELVTLLAETERATLERVANELHARHNNCVQMLDGRPMLSTERAIWQANERLLYHLLEWIDKQIKEIQP